MYLDFFDVVHQIGVSCFAALAVVVAAFPVQGVLGKMIARLQVRSTRLTDERVRRMTEVLNSMLLIKFNGWETNFSQACQKVREDEVKELKGAEVIKALNFACFLAIPVAAAAASFAAYTIGEGNELTSPKAFACLAWLIVFMRAFVFLPCGATTLSEGTYVASAGGKLQAVTAFSPWRLSTAPTPQLTCECT